MGSGQRENHRRFVHLRFLFCFSDNTPAELEAMLILSLAITSSPQLSNVDKNSDQEEDDWEQSSVSRPTLSTNNLRTITRQEDSDSDFDL